MLRASTAENFKCSENRSCQIPQGSTSERLQAIATSQQRLWGSVRENEVKIDTRRIFAEGRRIHRRTNPSFRTKTTGHFADLPCSRHRANRSDTFASYTHMTVSAAPQ